VDKLKRATNETEEQLTEELIGMLNNKFATKEEIITNNEA
jgi:hypothetical protein